MEFDFKGNTRNRRLKLENKDQQFWLKPNEHTFKGVLRDLNFNEIKSDLGGNFVKFDNKYN